jgi:hypothetical protein
LENILTGRWDDKLPYKNSEKEEGKESGGRREEHHGCIDAYTNCAKS